MAQPIITVIGIVATQPEVQTTKNRGTPFAAFRLAHTERRFNPRSNRWEDGDTSWYSVTCWRSFGENVAQSLKLGQPVVVTGRLKMREIITDGKPRHRVELHAISVGHDIKRGISNFTKVNRPAADFVDEDAEVSDYHDRLAEQSANSPWSQPTGAEGSQPRENEPAQDGSRPEYGLGAPFASSALADEAASAEAEKQAA